MSEPRHEAVVGAAMLGLVKAHGWMEMPIVLDVNRTCEIILAAGGVGVGRIEAVAFARGLIDQACDANGWERPGYSPDEEAAIALLLGRAYDELVDATSEGGAT